MNPELDYDTEIERLVQEEYARQEADEDEEVLTDRQKRELDQC